MRVTQRLTGRGDVGGLKLRCACERLYGGVIPHHEIEHMREKMRVGGGRAQRLRTDSTFGEEKAKTLRVAGDKRERLNRNDFSYFTGIVNRLFQRQCLPFA